MTDLLTCFIQLREKLLLTHKSHGSNFTNFEPTCRASSCRDDDRLHITRQCQVDYNLLRYVWTYSLFQHAAPNSHHLRFEAPSWIWPIHCFQILALSQCTTDARGKHRITSEHDGSKPWPHVGNMSQQHFPNMTHLYNCISVTVRQLKQTIHNIRKLSVETSEIVLRHNTLQTRSIQTPEQP